MRQEESEFVLGYDIPRVGRLAEPGTRFRYFRRIRFGKQLSKVELRTCMAGFGCPGPPEARLV